MVRRRKTSRRSIASLPASARWLLMVMGSVVVLLAFASVARAETTTSPKTVSDIPSLAPGQEMAGMPSLPDLRTRKGIAWSFNWLVMITVISLVPAVALLVTSFTRIIVVLGLLRHAMGTQQMPPNMVLTGLAFFLTLLVMMPVIKDVHSQSLGPYFKGELSQAEALTAGESRIRRFMIGQLEAAGNSEDVKVFLDEELAAKADLTWRDVDTTALIPAFVVSELKVAFIIGFQIFLPFVIIDMLVASVLTSMGMLMLPPVLISLPFKLLMFVLADGWERVVGTLIQSFG